MGGPRWGSWAGRPGHEAGHRRTDGTYGTHGTHGGAMCRAGGWRSLKAVSLRGGGEGRGPAAARSCAPRAGDQLIRRAVDGGEGAADSCRDECLTRQLLHSGAGTCGRLLPLRPTGGCRRRRRQTGRQAGSTSGAGCCCHMALRGKMPRPRWPGAGVAGVASAGRKMVLWQGIRTCQGIRPPSGREGMRRWGHAPVGRR